MSLVSHLLAATWIYTCIEILQPVYVKCGILLCVDDTLKLFLKWSLARPSAYFLWHGCSMGALGTHTPQHLDLSHTTF